MDGARVEMITEDLGTCECYYCQHTYFLSETLIFALWDIGQECAFGFKLPLKITSSVISEVLANVRHNIIEKNIVPSLQTLATRAISCSINPFGPVNDFQWFLETVPQGLRQYITHGTGEEVIDYEDLCLRMPFGLRTVPVFLAKHIGCTMTTRGSPGMKKKPV